VCGVVGVVVWVGGWYGGCGGMGGCGGVGGGVRSNIPRSALSATLDTYNFIYSNHCCIFKCSNLQQKRCQNLIKVRSQIWTGSVIMTSPTN
jgi:hypothetical protein